MATPTNLPATATAGQVLTAQYVNDLRGAFRVLQVVQFTTSASQAFTTTSPVASALTVSITPQAASNKVLIMATCSGVNYQSGTNGGLDLWLYRSTTSLIKFGAQIAKNGTTNERWASPASVIYLDSPNTTSATSYVIRGATSDAGGTAVFNWAGSTTSSIIAVEISA
jgi:hypothetical protein